MSPEPAGRPRCRFHYGFFRGESDVSSIPACRRNEGVLAAACVMLFIGAWIDKGMGMIAGGFVPNPLHEVNEYMPTGPEVAITLGVWAAGFIVLTILYKMATGVKEEAAGL